MVLALGLHPRDREDFLVDVAAVEGIEFAIISLELESSETYLRVIVEPVFAFLAVGALENDNPSGFVAESWMRTILVEFQNRDDILLVYFLVAALVAKNLGALIFATFTFIFHDSNILLIILIEIFLKYIKIRKRIPNIHSPYP